MQTKLRKLLHCKQRKNPFDKENAARERKNSPRRPTNTGIYNKDSRRLSIDLASKEKSCFPGNEVTQFTSFLNDIRTPKEDLRRHKLCANAL